MVKQGRSVKNIYFLLVWLVCTLNSSLAYSALDCPRILNEALEVQTTNLTKMNKNVLGSTRLFKYY